MDENNYIVISDYHYGEVYESRENFGESMFHRVYRRAYDIVQDSVSRQLKKEKTRTFQENVDNIVTFIGRRGTGKSSAMISFMQGLLENCDEKRTEDFTIYDTTEYGDRKKIRFIDIDWIDASLLEKGEDIFEEILAKMLKKFMEEDEVSGFSCRHDYEKKDLYRRFDSIYRKLLNVKKRGQVEVFTSEMAMSNLRDLARSTDIRKEFQCLVEEYIRMKEDYYEEKAETFLVVAIDDMDMNVNAGFEILEKVQRYLRVRHLIVLLAVNQEQMKLCCERHFAEIFEKQIGYKVENRKKRISELADQYMEKGLPLYTRVYLPSLKKMDYDRNHVTKMKIEGEENRIESIKMAVFITMWKKTRVRYDVEGKKRHFMEPQSLRELNNSGIFRKHMKDLIWDKDDKTNFLEQLDFNYRRCMDDLLFRYANEILSGEDSRFFLQLSEMDIRRRGETIVSRFCAMAERKNEGEIENYESEIFRVELLDGYKKFRYSYGEMLHAIFCFGRMDVHKKPLIHALLAMYTLTLTKIFYRYKEGDTGSDLKKRNYVMLKELLCDSIGGSWSRQLLPKVRIQSLQPKHLDSEKSFYAGAAKGVKSIFKLVISEKGREIVLESLKSHNDLEDEVQMEDWYQKLPIEERKEIEWQFILFMFLSTNYAQYSQKNEQVETNDEIKEVDGIGGKEEQAYVETVVENADYNIMNFVNNTFIFNEKVIEFADKICGKDIGGVLKQHIENVETDIYGKENDNNKSFWKSMFDWHRQFGGMVIPAYAIDVYYNMFKRLTREQVLHKPEIIEKENLYPYFQKLLKDIEDKLGENDKEYWDNRNDMDNNGEEISFRNIFEACPVIKRLKKMDENEKEKYNDYTYLLVSGKNDILSDNERLSKLIDM